MGNPYLKDTSPQLMKIGQLGYLAALKILRVVRVHLLSQCFGISKRKLSARILNGVKKNIFYVA